MKVILIKDCKDGKVNQIIEVSDGYAKNFLIKKELALPVNSKTTKILNEKIATNLLNENKNIENAKKVKEAIEKIVLKYKLKVSNSLVHGSVSRKQIHHDLHKKGIKVDSHAITNAKIVNIGFSEVKVNIYKDIKAALKIEVVKDGE